MKKILISLLLCGSAALVQGQDLLTFGGYHTQLHGYKDQRYVGDDKGDYLKALAWFTGTEIVQRGFKTDSPDSEHVVLGGGVLLYVQNGFDPVTLYGVPSQSIAQETVPSSLDARSSQFQLSASVFGGYQDTWWGAEGGLSVFIKGTEEKVREKWDAGGTKVSSPGRGWVFGDGSLILPNFRLRAGAEEYPHFLISLFRENYDPSYGALQARVVLPFQNRATLVVGGSLFQTSSIYVEPGIQVAAAHLALRVGTILNYNDAAFTRVGIFEGAFVSGSVDLQL